jgi:alpha-1,3-glucosyltransferase
MYATKLWSDPSYQRFLHAMILSAYTSFLFGWHVHEKAVLLFLIPLTFVQRFEQFLLRLPDLLGFGRLVAFETFSFSHFRVFVISSCAGIFSLFPLLIDPAGG